MHGIIILLFRRIVGVITRVLIGVIKIRIRIRIKDGGANHDESIFDLNVVIFTIMILKSL